MIDWKTFARARWCRNGTASWILKQPVKDGSAILAAVWEHRGAYSWQAGSVFDWHPTKRGAMAGAKYRAWCNVGKATGNPPALGEAGDE